MRLIALALLAACQTAGALTPAVLARGDEASLAAVRGVLAGALGRTNIVLGPDDLTRSSSFTVLPPGPTPALDHNTALPIVFDIRLRGETCLLVRRESGQTYALSGVACRPAPG